jgi:ankyrin repeat protein
MKRLPDRPNLEHLKRQAKDLLVAYRGGDVDALARFRNALPAAARKDDAALGALGLALHDAQSCVAREYGFASWADLRSFVQARSAYSADRDKGVLDWLRLVYAGHIAGGNGRTRPTLAARMLEENPGFAGDDPYLACAIGDEAKVRRAVGGNRSWVNDPGGLLELPPLVAVTHSSLLRLPAFRDRLHACAEVLLEAGADPNQSVANRWDQVSISEASETHLLSALYGACGQNHDAQLTRLLLEAGANPNDGESLYHSLESYHSSESLACTRLLLQAGARASEANAIYRVLDFDNVDALRLLLSHGADPNEPAKGPPISDWGSPLLWAIRRRRSPAHIGALLEAGADASARTPDGADAHTLALRFGLRDVARLLEPVESSSPEEQFIAACAEADEAAARRLQSQRSDLPQTLSEAQLRLLPELAAQGCDEAVKVMVKLGWPIAVSGGDWQASALNHAVFRGNAELTRFLLEHGASWVEMHGHGDNACGTLAWASCNEPVEGGNWLGCAEALVAHGMPTARPDPAGPERVIINGRRKRFSEEVREFLLGAEVGPTVPTRP